MNLESLQLERFSKEYRKTKTELITLTNHNRKKAGTKLTNQKWKQIGVISVKQWENACEQVIIGFGFTSNWLRKWRELF